MKTHVPVLPRLRADIPVTLSNQRLGCELDRHAPSRKRQTLYMS